MLQTAIFITAMVWSLTAGAEAYQCTLPDGRTVYQQAPCDAAPQPLDPNTQDTGTGGRRPSEREFLDERAQSNRQKQEGATTGTPNPKAQECAAGARPLAGGKKPDRHPDPHQRHGQRRV